MENVIVSAILIFNIILMVAYFIVRINRRNINHSQETVNKFVKREKENNVSKEEQEKIKEFLFNSELNPINQNHCIKLIDISIELYFIKKEELEKGVNEYGLIIHAINQNKLINFTPVSFIDKTGKDTFLIKNPERNLLGLFTPFHVIIFNTTTLEFTQSVEDDFTEHWEDISFTRFTKEGVRIDDYKLKVQLPLLNADTFVETYYLTEFRSHLNG